VLECRSVEVEVVLFDIKQYSSGSRASTLTQDENLILFGRSPTGGLSGSPNPLGIFCWASRADQVACCPLPALPLPAPSQDGATCGSSRLDLSRGRGASTVTVAVQLITSSGVRASRFVAGRTGQVLRFAVSTCNDGFGSS